MQRAQKAGVAGCLVKPFRERSDAGYRVALALQQFRAMEREVDNLQEALEARKAVDRAKGSWIPRD